MSILAYAVAAAVARFIPQDVVVTRLQARVDELEAELEETRRESARWQALTRSWRERYEAQPQLLAQAQAQQAQMQAAYHMMQNANAQNVLGAQTLQLPAEYCNCVPARHDLFLQGIRAAAS